MEDYKEIWPSENEIDKSTESVDLAPYGVISQYANAVDSAYNNKIIGMITARFEEKQNGDRTNFVYSFYISLPDKAVQIKLFEVEVADDGWYPAKVYLTKPSRSDIGIASTEKQLRTFIENGIKSDFVKNQIKTLL